MLELKNVEIAVYEVLTDVQQLLGARNPPLTASSCPLGHIEGFDSLCAIEATVILEERLQISLPENAFVNPEGTKPLQVKDIILLCQSATRKRVKDAR